MKTKALVTSFQSYITIIRESIGLWSEQQYPGLFSFAPALTKAETVTPKCHNFVMFYHLVL